MLMIMYLCQFAILRYVFFCFIFQVFAFIAIHSSDENQELDNKVAFDVGQGGPQFEFGSTYSPEPEIDPSGYIAYCPCMGRFGNQADQFLGALAFSKGLNRTLILPPWISYPSYKIGNSERTPYSDWFRVGSLKAYHRVISMERFMKDIAPTLWPPGKRIGFCYGYKESKKCRMKEGNPFGPFWDHFGIEFDDYQDPSGLMFDSGNEWTRNQWNERFPASRYPVIALQGAPGSFPVDAPNRKLQQFMKWSRVIDSKANDFIKKELPEGPFVGIHLRNGVDFVNSCEHVKDSDKLFASPQCIGPGSKKKLTYEMCLPPVKEILRRTKKIVKKAKAKSVFVATDNNPMIKELTKVLKKQKVTILQRAPEDEISDPIVDLAILTKADYFIGNCVSSFSSFVKRARDVEDKLSAFWSFDESQ